MNKKENYVTDIIDNLYFSKSQYNLNDNDIFRIKCVAPVLYGTDKIFTNMIDKLVVLEIKKRKYKVRFYFLVTIYVFIFMVMTSGHPNENTINFFNMITFDLYSYYKNLSGFGRFSFNLLALIMYGIYRMFSSTDEGRSINENLKKYLIDLCKNLNLQEFTKNQQLENIKSSTSDINNENLAITKSKNKKGDDKFKSLSQSLPSPEKVTLSWLFIHVPVKFWVGILCLLFSFFVFGVKASQVSLIQELFGLIQP